MWRVSGLPSWASNAKPWCPSPTLFRNASVPVYRPCGAAGMKLAASVALPVPLYFANAAVIKQVNKIGKGRLVLAGLWTSVCIVGPTLSALEQGFEVYVVADACGDVSAEAHNRAMERMVQAGAQPMTALQYLLELQRDWARTVTYESTTGIASTYGGSYGLGVIYAKTMFHGHGG